MLIGKNEDQDERIKVLEELDRLSDQNGVSAIPRRIELCNQALRLTSKEHEPMLWGKLQNDLACSLLETPTGIRTKNIEQAVECFNKALEIHTGKVFSEDWAMLQKNLGIAYTVQVNDRRADNIEQAIHHSEQALRVYNKKTFPQHWATVQDTLGNAYRERIRGDQIKNIEQSISYFKQALKVRTRQALPKDWARTQRNLGNTYLARFDGKREKNIEQAIWCFRQALEVFDRQDSPEDWSLLHNSLGNAYMAFIKDERAETAEEIKNVDEAILNYTQALEVRTSQAFPEDWAETQSNLAGAKRIRASVEDIEQAIRDLESILKIYTRETFPQYWARTHSNLAIIYTDLKQGKKVGNIKQAMEHYQDALKIYTPQDFPDNCLNTARGLGNRAFDGQYWELAQEAYDKALKAQDILMQASFTIASEKVDLAETQNLSPRAAYAHMKTGNAPHAVEVLEKGRAQLLRESFEYQHQALERLSKTPFKYLYDDYMQARETCRALQRFETPQTVPQADWKQALQQVQAAAAAIREIAGREYPQYRHFLQTLSFAEIQEQSHEKPIVYLCTTSAGGLIFVVSMQGVQVLEIPELEQEALQKQIWRPTNEEIDRINAHLKKGMITLEDIQAVKGGYFSMYALWSLNSRLINTSKDLKWELFSGWQKTLDETTRWLWEKVMEKLIPVLKEHNSSAVLIPSGQLALLPLHAAWTDDPSKPTKRRYVLDELNISYAPSTHALYQARAAAEQPAENESLLVVDNPDGSLKFAKDEVQAVMDGFQRITHLHKKKATTVMVKKEMQKAHVLHFATHGRAGWEKAEQAQLLLANGILTLPDIFKLDLNQARLVVLSACETGVPGLELIDEMIGLPAGMLQAGVPGVIGSLWSVNDASTAILMTQFYKFWRKEGKTPQQALRQAQIWLRDSLYESPYDWAAFTYTGV